MTQRIQIKNKIITVLAMGKYATSGSEIQRHVWKKISRWDQSDRD